ncbi:PrsW family glutamic-type intramembrane protease [Chloroflexota bacterium]
MLNTARVVTLIASLAIALFGVLAGAAGLMAGVFGPEGDRLMVVTLGASFLALSGVLGLAMAWQAWQAIQGKPSGTFEIRRPGLVALLILCAMALGQLVLSLDLLPVLALPPLHVLATALPPILVLVLVARGLDLDSRWREVVLQLGSGAFLSTALALVLELVLVVGLVLVLFAALVMYGGLEPLELLVEQLQDPAVMQDPSALAPLVRSPLVVATVFLVAAVAIPIIEEVVKTVGVGLFSYKHPSRAESFLWGIACGAGFALAEGLFNSLGGLDSWGSVVLLRLGATLLHCLTGGLMGLAWYAIIAERRWARGLGLFVCSVSIHGFWNALSISLTLVSLTNMVSGAGLAENQVSLLATTALVALLAAAILGTGLSLAWLTRYLGRASVAASASSDLLGGVAVTLSPNAADDDQVS